MSEIKDLIPYFFQGTNSIIATIALIVIGLYAWWIFAKKPEQKKAKKLVWFSFIVALVSGCVMFVHSRLEKTAHTFPKGQTGVLILRIAGDDVNNSLQRDIVESLRSELKRVSSQNSIVVLASDQQLGDTKVDGSAAHQTARSFGKQFNAQLVVWGDRVGDKKFWPHVTIVNQEIRSVILGDRELGVQEIDHLQLPLELVAEPVCLAHSIAGFSAYQSGRFDEALTNFEIASKLTNINSAEIAPVLFYAATCRLYLCETRSDPRELLITAIDELQFAANAYGKTNAPDDWAMTEINLGSAKFALSRLIQGAEAPRLLGEAVRAFRAALEVRTRGRFPWGWALAQNNLGAGLDDQAKQSQGAEAMRLFGEANTAFRAALEVYSREQFPNDWARTQGNLGAALGNQAKQSQGAEAAPLLVEAVTAFRAALEVQTRDQLPQDWAKTQHGLGAALVELAKQRQGPEAVRLFEEAVTAHRAALEVYTREKFPPDWARIQSNLGTTLSCLAEQSQGAEAAPLLVEAVTAYRAALEVQTRDQLPQDWAKTQHGLGVALFDLARQSQGAKAARFLEEAITAYRAALEIYTFEGFPSMNRGVSNNLALAEQALQKLHQ